ncbi:type III pantothenate kinase [Acholeplasma granularum]|uniref:type III pantothenate kinase n=1 Tax=Acholeplasma granularum TaxID=264635 RepID=UPI0004BCFD72|nr:type III pantothenate kinase [Acholeplasma granularum]
MIILFDVGNTSIYTGLSDGEKIIETFRINTDSTKTPDEYYITLNNFLNNRKITGVVIGSVVPAVTITLLRISQKYFNLEPVIVEPGTKTGILVKADNPREVGADLIADAAGLSSLEPTLIIDLGTANKFIYVKNNQITGVIISPGVELSIKALDGNTALLHNVEIKAPKKYLGNNTITCIQSGVVYGTVVMLEGMVARIKEEVNEEFKVVLTGGLSKLISEHIRLNITRDSRLVLKGLLNIYLKNNK